MPVDTTKTDFVRGLFNDAITNYGRTQLVDIDKKRRQRIGEIINENMMSSLNPKTVSATTPDLTRPDNFVGPGQPTPSGQESFGTKTSSYTVPPSPMDIFSGYARTKAALDQEALPSNDLEQMVGTYARLQPRRPMLPTHVKPGDMVLNPMTGQYEQTGTPSTTASSYRDTSLALRQKADARQEQNIVDRKNRQNQQDVNRTQTDTKKKIDVLTKTNQALGQKMRNNSVTAATQAAGYKEGDPQWKAANDNLTTMNQGLQQQVADNEKELERLNSQIGGKFKAGQTAPPSSGMMTQDQFVQDFQKDQKRPPSASELAKAKGKYFQ